VSVLDKSGAIVRVLGENTVEEDTNNTPHRTLAVEAGALHGSAAHGRGVRAPQGRISSSPSSTCSPGACTRFNRQPGSKAGRGLRGLPGLVQSGQDADPPEISPVVRTVDFR
jgi:hypothetical protein